MYECIRKQASCWHAMSTAVRTTHPSRLSLGHALGADELRAVHVSPRKICRSFALLFHANPVNRPTTVIYAVMGVNEFGALIGPFVADRPTAVEPRSVLSSQWLHARSGGSFFSWTAPQPTTWHARRPDLVRESVNAERAFQMLHKKAR